MDYETFRGVRNINNPFAQMVGIKVTDVKEGYARTAVELKHEHMNPMGACHGGLLLTLADVAAGAAAISLGNLAMTVSTDYHFLNGAKEGSVIYAEGRVVKAGKTIVVLDITVREEGSERLLGTGSYTYYRLEDKVEN